MKLRPYQAQLKAEVQQAWRDGAANVVMRLDTGGGKTAILASMVSEHHGASCVIAHRQELVLQLSLTLAKYGVRHRVICSRSTAQIIAAAHVAEYGYSFLDPNSRCAVASVDTLIRRKDLLAWAAQVTLWITDEGHHLVRDNKWDRAISIFDNKLCRGLLPTATPERPDGKGLGAHADGVAHALIEGPPMRWLIEEGFLTDYDVVTALSDIQLLEADIGASGDWTPKQLREAAKRSHITGDAVTAYLTHTPGRLGVTFAPDVETAKGIVGAYRAGGVRAELLTGETEDGYRRQVLRQFAARKLDQIVAVDIISEGFDLPAIEVGTMDRKTASLITYMQQFGRILRPLYAPGFDLETTWGRLQAIATGPKPRAVLIDQVGNFRHHGPPDKPRVWTLDGRERRGKGGGIPLKICGSGWKPADLAAMGLAPCYREFEAFYKKCPHCQLPLPPVEPVGRRSPQQVEGELALLDRDVLDQLRGAVSAAQMSVADYQVWLHSQRVDPKWAAGHVKTFQKRQAAQSELWPAIEAFGGPRRAAGRSDGEIQREFFMRFGVDPLTAQTLDATKTGALTAKIWEHINGG